MVLYADDTSIIITDTDKLNFEINLNQTFRHKYMVQCQFTYFKLPENPILGISVHELV
jgi:hypothetical protein